MRGWMETRRGESSGWKLLGLLGFTYLFILFYPNGLASFKNDQKKLEKDKKNCIFIILHLFNGAILMINLLSHDHTCNFWT